jgi:single-strand DNA-binding protein
VNEPAITITGNLTADPELRFTPAGQAAASFTIASTPRYRDSASGEWKDGETWFVRCTAWRDLGTNIAETLTKGTAVVATGRLRSRTWEADDGTRRTAVELTVDDLGPSLRRAVAKVVKATRERPAPDSGPAADPWANEPAGTPAGEIPF